MSSTRARTPRRGDADTDAFPFRLAFSVWIVQLYNGIQYAEVFTLAVYAVRRFEGPAATEQRIGQLAGLLAATSSFAVGIAAWPWGLVSDRVGRKPIILIGNCSTAACILVFGTAKAYWIALVSRLAAGVLDGSLVMTKVMVGEMCSPRMQARVMSYLALGDAMGNILGPALGGLLSDPCSRFQIFRESRFCSSGSPMAVHPFLLPCALTACLGILTSITNVLTMEETRKRPSPDPAGAPHGEAESEPLRGKEGMRALEMVPPAAEADPETAAEMFGESSIVRPESTVSSSKGGKHQDVFIAANDASETPEGQSAAGLRHALGQNFRPGSLEIHDSVQSAAGVLPRKASSTTLDVRWSAGSNLGEEVTDEHEGLLASSVSARDIEEGQEVTDKDSSVEERWWRNKPLIMMLGVTAWMLSIAKYNDELGPVFVSAPIEQGGLGMPLSAFALPLSFGGVVLTLFALFGYPRLQRAVGLKMTCSIGLLTGIPGDLILPTAALLRKIRFLEQAAIYVAIAITKLTTQTVFTASMVVINSLAPREQLGSVNGVRMMVAALGRSTGPVLGGTIWGLSATLSFPGHHYLGFLVASVALIGCWYLNHRIPINIAT